MKFLISPALAPWRRGPSDRARSQSSSGVSTKTSRNSRSSTRLAHHLPLGAERRDEGAEHDQAGVHHQLGDLADAADILDAVGFGEAEIAVEPMAHVVAVEQHRCDGWSACSVCSTMLAMVDLPEPDRPVNHRIAGFWLLERRARRPCRVRAAASGYWCARRKPKSIMPAPTVWLLKRSMMMKEPVLRLSA